MSMPNSARFALALSLLSVAACNARGPGAPVTRTPQVSVGPAEPAKPVEADGPFEGISVVPVEIRFSAPAAKRYGEEVVHEPTLSEAAVGRTLTEMGLQSDPALHRVARELAATAPDGANLPSGLADAAMAWAGLVNPPPPLAIVEMPEDPAGCHAVYSPACEPAVRSLVEKVQRRRGAVPARFGVGVVGLPDGRTRLIAAVLDPMVQLDPMPAAVGLGQSLRVHGRLIGDRRAPRVEVVDVQGHALEAPTAMSADGTFSADVACGDRKGRMQVEVMAQGAYGPEVAANFPVSCGLPEATSVHVEIERLASGVDAAQIARASFEHLNAERKRHGLPQLAWDDRAGRVAEAHSKEMVLGDFVGHVSPKTGTATDRFVKAELDGLVIRENVARGFGPKGIHDSLMASPGHRVHMLATDVTHVGIGVVLGPWDPEFPQAPRAVYCTQNLFKKPGAGAPPAKQLAPTIALRVDAQRKRGGQDQGRWDPGLDALAMQVAERVAAGRSLEADWGQAVFELGYESFDTVEVTAADFDALHKTDVFGADVLMAGIGVVRASEERGGEFVMVALIAER